MVHGWPNQEWFPELLDLMVDFSLALSLVPKLLRQTFSQHFHLESEPTRLEVIKEFYKEGFFFLKRLLTKS